MGWIAPAIGAVGSLGGAAMGGKAANKAAQAQLTGNREALAYQRQRDTQSRADWEKAMANWDARRQVLLQRYGIELPAATQVAQSALAAPGGAMAGGGGMPGGGGMAGGRGASLADLVMGRPGGYTGVQLT